MARYRARDRDGSELEPMSLANMRASGVRHLAIECQDCRHNAVLLVDTLPGEIYVPDAGELFRCSICNSKQVLTRPAWHLQHPKPFGTG